MIRDKLSLNEGAGDLEGDPRAGPDHSQIERPFMAKVESALKGSGALQDDEREHREEVNQDAKGA